MTQQPNRQDPGFSVPVRPGESTGSRSSDVRISGDGLGDILEVFGSKPLVQGPPAVAPDAVGEVVVERPSARAENGPATTVAVPWGTHLLDDPLATPDDDPSGAGRSTRTRGAARSVVESPGLEALTASVQKVLEAQARVAEILEGGEARLLRLESQVDALARQTAFLPPKLRGLGQKVEELGSTLSDKRTRDVLRDMLDLGDLIEAAVSTLPASVDNGHPLAESLRFFHALAARFRQILEVHKVKAIVAEGPFDPEQHQAVDSVPVASTEQDGSVVEVYRRGYRTEHQVLRYAEVSVGRHADPAAPEAPETPEALRTDDGEGQGPSLAQATLTPRRQRAANRNSGSDDQPARKPGAEKDDR